VKDWAHGKKGGEERETRRGGTRPSQVALDQSQEEVWHIPQLLFLSTISTCQSPLCCHLQIAQIKIPHPNSAQQTCWPLWHDEEMRDRGGKTGQNKAPNKPYL